MKPETRARLPQAAKEYIHDLEVDLKNIRKVLKDIYDTDTPSYFFMMELVDGKFVKKFIQGYRLGCETQKLDIDINVTEKGEFMLYFNGINGNDAYVKPQASNCISIVSIPRKEV